MNTQLETAREHDARTHLPLYLAGFGASATAMSALGSVLGPTLFVVAMFALLAEGFVISWLVRQGRLSKSTRDFMVGIILVCSVLAVMLLPGPRSILLDPNSLQPGDPSVAGVLAWLLAVCSFNLTTGRSVLFMCVPSLSLIGLVGTLGAGPAIIVFFVVFLAFACFVLIRQNTLFDSETSAPTAGMGSVGSHVVLTARITAVAILIGLALGTMLYQSIDTAIASRFTHRNRAMSIAQFTPVDYLEVATGPVSLSEQEVMQVRCKENLLWRGQAFDKYTGNGWLNTIGRSRGDSTTHQNSFLRVNADPRVERRATRQVVQQYKVESSRFNVVYAAAEPVSISFTHPQTLLVSPTRIGSAKFYGRDTKYTVVSEVPAANAGALSASSTDYPAFIRSHYLSLPESCREVSDLAREITAGAGNPYEKVLRIQSYVSVNHKYDMNVPATPDGRDAVAHFLLNSKRGYCDIFSSSMVVMCRAVGVPARWVVGFASGEMDEDDPDLYHVRLKDQHAWVEVYFQGYGWIPFDPTPGGEETSWTDRLVDAGILLRQKLAQDAPTMLVGGLILLMLAYLIKIEVLDRRRRQTDSTEWDPAFAAGGAARNYRRMCELLSRAGYPRLRTDTPSEYASAVVAALKPRLGESASAVHVVTADFEEARYAGRDLSEERSALGEELLEILRRELRSAGRQVLRAQRSGFAGK